MATTAPRHRPRHPAPDVPDDGRVPLLRGPRPGALLRGPRPRHDPPRRRPGGRRGRLRGGDARRRLHVLHVPRPQPHPRPGRADGADLRRAVRARDRAARRQGRLDAPDQRRARRDGLVRHRRRPPADRPRARPGRRSTAARARSPSASSATARPTSGRSTRRSTWPRSGRPRSSSSARTTCTWSTRRSATVTAVEHPAADRAVGLRPRAIIVDGNDVDAVYAVARTAIDRARAGDGPSLIEALTYRHGGHSRADPGKYRPDEEVAAWMARDPIPTYRARLEAAGVDAADARRDRGRDPRRGRRRRGRGARRPRAVAGRARDPGLERRRLGMAELTYRAAVAAGIAQEMRRDPSVVLIGEDVGAAGGVFKLTEGLFDGVRAGARPRHADQRAGHRRGGDGRGDDRPPADRRADVLATSSPCLGHGRQPDRQDPLHDRRPGLPAARAPDGQRRRPALRRAAQPERRELGDGHPGPQGRRAVDARPTWSG